MLLATHQAVFALYAGINGLLLLLLSIWVVRRRVTTKTVILDEGKDEMVRAIRAHANASEYIPIGLLLIAALVLVKGSILVVHVVGITLTLGRIIHAFGLTRSSGLSSARLVGMLLTWIAILVGSIAAIVYAMV